MNYEQLVYNLIAESKLCAYSQHRLMQLGGALDTLIRELRQIGDEPTLVWSNETVRALIEQADMVCKRCRLPLSDASLEAGNCETCRIHGGVLVTVTECEDCL